MFSRVCRTPSRVHQATKRNFSSWNLASTGYNERNRFAPKPPSKNPLFLLLVVGGLYAVKQKQK